MPTMTGRPIFIAPRTVPVIKTSGGLILHATIEGEPLIPGERYETIGKGVITIIRSDIHPSNNEYDLILFKDENGTKKEGAFRRGKSETLTTSYSLVRMYNAVKQGNLRVGLRKLKEMEQSCLQPVQAT